VTPARGTPCRVSSVVMGSFIKNSFQSFCFSREAREKIAVHSLCAKENRKGQKRRTPASRNFAQVSDHPFTASSG
jgi:hypothetical protein